MTTTKHTSVDNQPKWKSTILSFYPAAIFENNGIYIYATVNSYDVGYYSIAGNYGKVFDKPLDDYESMIYLGE